MPRHEDFLAGCIYKVVDERIRLPDNASRQPHKERRSVIIVSDQKGAHGSNSYPPSLWPSVLVVPLSTSRRDRTVFDVEIPYGQGEMNKTAWARVPALQVMDKEFLVDMSGQVSEALLDQVTAMILDYLGILRAEEPGPAEESDLDEMPF